MKKSPIAGRTMAVEMTHLAIQISNVELANRVARVEIYSGPPQTIKVCSGGGGGVSNNLIYFIMKLVMTDTQKILAHYFVMGVDIVSSSNASSRSWECSQNGGHLQFNSYPGDDTSFDIQVVPGANTCSWQVDSRWPKWRNLMTQPMRYPVVCLGMGGSQLDTRCCCLDECRTTTSNSTASMPSLK